MRSRLITSAATAVLATGILLGTAACSDFSGSIDRSDDLGMDDDLGSSDFSVEHGATFTDSADAADAIAAGDLPADLPDDARSIALVEADGTVYASWRGSAIADASCTDDADAVVPTMPESARKKSAPKQGVTTCDFGKQATAGGFTYFWKNTV